MKIKVTKTTEEEVEVSFPCYRKSERFGVEKRFIYMPSMYLAEIIIIWDNGSFHRSIMALPEQIMGLFSETEPASAKDWNDAMAAFASRCHLFISNNLETQINTEAA